MVLGHASGAGLAADSSDTQVCVHGCSGGDSLRLHARGAWFEGIDVRAWMRVYRIRSCLAATNAPAFSNVCGVGS